VGSANEHPGITGISHLFEHMMFKGTEAIGTTDYQKDLEILAEQEKVRDQMREEDAKMRAAYRRGEVDDLMKPESKTARWNELNKRFKELIEAERKVLVKNEFDQVYTKAGGSGKNAYTSQDRTAYFITVPANKLELWMWMESERIRHPVFREFYAERDVVFEERRMRTESTPLGKFVEEAEAMFWQSAPYSWPVLGWPSDVSSISKAQADEFYALYYSPQNITLILVGDFKVAEAQPLLRKYFGRIPRGKTDPPDVVTLEMPQLAEKRMNAEAEANPQVEVGWHTVPFGHRDSYALNILAQLNFISLREGPSGPASYALIYNPYKVVQFHHEQKTPGLRADKYNALLERAIDVVVRVRAAGVNRADRSTRRSPSPLPTSWGGGAEGAAGGKSHSGGHDRTAPRSDARNSGASLLARGSNAGLRPEGRPLEGDRDRPRWAGDQEGRGGVRRESKSRAGRRAGPGPDPRRGRPGRAPDPGPPSDRREHGPLQNHDSARLADAGSGSWDSVADGSRERTCVRGCATTFLFA